MTLPDDVDVLETWLRCMLEVAVALVQVEEVLAGTRRWVVLHGDCREVLAVLPERSVEHVITDPPYGRHVHELQRRLKVGAGGGPGETGTGHKVVEAPLPFEPLAVELQVICGYEFARVATRWVVVKTDAEGRHLWQAALEAGGARHLRAGVWVKIGCQPSLHGRWPAQGHEEFELAHAVGEGAEPTRWNGGGKAAVWAHAIATDRNQEGRRTHPTQTPISLWLEMVGDFTGPGEVVLDAFAGTGSLGVACVRLGRRYIGVEKEEGWAQEARLALETDERQVDPVAFKRGQRGLFEGVGS